MVAHNANMTKQDFVIVDLKHFHNFETMREKIKDIVEVRDKIKEN